MKKLGVILALAIAAVVAIVAWQVTWCYVAESELQSDMKDLAVQNGARIGWTSFSSEDELRDGVIARAKEHGIELQPQQVAVRRVQNGQNLEISLRADYEAEMSLLGAEFPIHFAPESEHSAAILVK